MRAAFHLWAILYNYFFNAPRAAPEELEGRMRPVGRGLATRALDLDLY